jgi:hypothetical protein|tara:strand:- start:127 stop:1215 length:1089 start_codon:yes stop_codon:yes gene_type:complete
MDFDADFGIAGPAVAPNNASANNNNSNNNNNHTEQGASQVLGSASQYLDHQQNFGISQGDGEALNTDIAKLRQALWNEKAAPEVLQYEEEVVEDLKELVDHQVSLPSKIYFVVFRSLKCVQFQNRINRVPSNGFHRETQLQRDTIRSSSECLVSYTTNFPMFFKPHLLIVVSLSFLFIFIKKIQSVFFHCHKQTHLHKRNLQQGLVDQAGETVEEKFKADLYQREINRVVYLLKSYLRARFLKITRHAKYILSSGEMMSKLSKAEAELVVVPYVNLKETHLKTTFLNDLPEKFQGVSDNTGSDPSMIDSPNLDEYVFCRVLDDIGTLRVSDDQDLELNVGDIYALRYSTIQGLLLQGKLHLV